MFLSFSLRQIIHKDQALLTQYDVTFEQRLTLQIIWYFRFSFRLFPLLPKEKTLKRFRFNPNWRMNRVWVLLIRRRSKSCRLVVIIQNIHVSFLIFVFLTLSCDQFLRLVLRNWRRRWMQSGCGAPKLNVRGTTSP